jgi:thiol-disulfide isomerase/thioredoxin
LLVKDVAAEFKGRVRVKVEDYGSSEIAKRFGVRRYPVVFVDDVLMARPKDFGFAGPEDISGGLYVPWREPANQQRFKADLRRMVSRRLAGERVTGLNIADVATADASLDGPPQLPPLSLTAIAGAPLSPAYADDRVVVVELWATWCPPCRSTLEHLNEVRRKYEKNASVIAIAVDSPREEVTRMANTVKASYSVVFGTEEIVKAFGAVAAVPKVLVFDRTGRLRHVIHGAPPDLNKQLDGAIADALSPLSGRPSGPRDSPARRE